MNRFAILIVGALFAVVSTFSHAETAAKPDPRVVIKKTLTERFPDITVEDISPSPLPGLWEVLVGDDLAYVNEDASYLILGKMMDTKTREDVTQKRLDKLHAISFDSLPLNLAIKTVKGTGARKMAVFADPHCPYCAKLEQELKSVDNVTVYTFLYPLESIHPGAKETAEKIWCSPDRSAAWTDAMLNRKEPSAAVCKNDTVTKVLALGEKLHINSTPTIFFADGHRVAGALPQAQIEQQFVSAATK
jgi:thiol:disulfide interchange protein DsbC